MQNATDNHYHLQYDLPNTTWSLKYNLLYQVFLLTAVFEVLLLYIHIEYTALKASPKHSMTACMLSKEIPLERGGQYMYIPDSLNHCSVCGNLFHIRRVCRKF